MPVGKSVDPATFNQQVVSRLLELDQMLNSPGLANVIEFIDSRDLNALKGAVPGLSANAEDDLQLGRMMEAIDVVKQVRDTWNTNGRSLMRFFSGLG